VLINQETLSPLRIMSYNRDQCRSDEFLCLIESDIPLTVCAIPLGRSDCSPVFADNRGISRHMSGYSNEHARRLAGTAIVPRRASLAQTVNELSRPIKCEVRIGLR
jgi:hypothetical protein